MTKTLHVALAALLLVALDAARPLVVDDAAEVYYARQIRADPSDPYGFEIHWNDDPGPARATAGVSGSRAPPACSSGSRCRPSTAPLPTFAALLLWNLLAGRASLGLLAGMAAAAIFCGREALMAQRYGESHLMIGLSSISKYHYEPSIEAPLVWSLGFLALVGAMAPAVGVLGLAALRAPAVRRGDWLVVPDGVIKPPIGLSGVSPARAVLAVRSASPWSTNPWAYLGPTPMRARSDALVAVWVHRVLRAFVPERKSEPPGRGGVSWSAEPPRVAP